MNHHAQGRVRVRTAEAAPDARLAPSILEILSRMGLHPDFDDPEPARPRLLAGADLVIPADAALPSEVDAGSNIIF